MGSEGPITIDAEPEEGSGEWEENFLGEPLVFVFVFPSFFQSQVRKRRNSEEAPRVAGGAANCRRRHES